MLPPDGSSNPFAAPPTAVAAASSSAPAPAPAFQFGVAPASNPLVAPAASTRVTPAVPTSLFVHIATQSSSAFAASNPFAAPSTPVFAVRSSAPAPAPAKRAGSKQQTPKAQCAAEFAARALPLMPLNNAERLEFRGIYIAIFAAKSIPPFIPPLPPLPSSLSKILIFDAELKKTDEQARAAVNNLFKKDAKAVRDCV